MPTRPSTHSRTSTRTTLPDAGDIGIEKHVFRSIAPLPASLGLGACPCVGHPVGGDRRLDATADVARRAHGWSAIEWVSAVFQLGCSELPGKSPDKDKATVLLSPTG